VAAALVRAAAESRMIVITGAAGFIGSNIAHALARRGQRVVAVDRLGREERWRNLAAVELHDLVAPEALPAWLKQHDGAVQAVVHMGAISSTTEADADLIVETNFRLSLSLWHWCTQAGRPFLYASSAATYGDGSAGFTDDESPQALAVLRPLNAYGWSKHLFDRRVAHDVASGAPRPPQWAGLKFFNVYGPNEYHKGEMRSVVARKFPAAARGEPVTLFRSYRDGVPDGGQRRDFVYVDDCVAVVEWLLAHPQVSGLFNVGSGTARSFSELAQALFVAVGHPANISYIEMPPPLRERYQYFTQADMTKLRVAGFSAAPTSLERGVQTYVEDYLSRADPYR
jgi:ADP-L-glycero-D-manno-heptose 6-epimerase